MPAQPVRQKISESRTRIPCPRLFFHTGILLLSLLPPAVSVSRADTNFIVSEETRALGLPFSDAVRIGNLLVLSGQLGVDPATFKLVDGGIEAETRQIFSNMRRILATSGTGLDAIVKCT